MSEMVERMARAAYERFHEKQNVGLAPEVAARRFTPWDKLNCWDRAFYLEAQRAAIGAMRKPTEAMIDAMESRLVDYEAEWVDAPFVWDSAITAALSSSSRPSGIRSRRRRRW